MGSQLGDAVHAQTGIRSRRVWTTTCRPTSACSPTPCRRPRSCRLCARSCGEGTPDLFGGAADAQIVGRARANHGMSGQRMIQPRDCCGLTANARESGIRPPSRGRHPLPGQVIAGNASDRHRVHQRAGRTPSRVMPGSALGRQHRWQVSASIQRGAAQPAHAA